MTRAATQPRVSFGIMTAQHLANVEPLRRTALMVAGVADLEMRLTDATLAMFEIIKNQPGR